MDWNGCLDKTFDTNVGVATLQCVPTVFQNVILGLLIFAGVITLFFLVWGGIKFILSGGDPKQVQGAQKTITFALVGLVLIFLSFFLLNLFTHIVNIDCINLFGFTNCR